MATPDDESLTLDPVVAQDATSLPLARPDRELDAATRRSLAQMERQIGEKYASHNVRMWPYVAIAIVGFAVFVATFPLAIAGVLPLWLGCVINSIIVGGGYVVGHEAMHSNIAREGTKNRFWNELTGWLSAFPMIVPFSMIKTMHLLHHQHTNDPAKDPDAIHAAPNLYRAAIRSWLNRQPGPERTADRWRRQAAELGTPAGKAAILHSMFLQLGVMAFFFTMAWSGYAIEVALLWWLPRHVGISYTQLVLSWAPHHPHAGTSRYDDTSIIRHKLGYWGSMGIDFHMIHHLYPYIPAHACRAAYREMKPILEARGVDCRAH